MQSKIDIFSKNAVNNEEFDRLLEELERLQIVNVNVEKSKLEKIIRATYTKNYPPKIVLHGYEFLLDLNNENGKK